MWLDGILHVMRHLKKFVEYIRSSISLFPWHLYLLLGLFALFPWHLAPTTVLSDEKLSTTFENTQTHLTYIKPEEDKKNNHSDKKTPDYEDYKQQEDEAIQNIHKLLEGEENKTRAKEFAEEFGPKRIDKNKIWWKPYFVCETFWFKKPHPKRKWLLFRVYDALKRALELQLQGDRLDRFLGVTALFMIARFLINVLIDRMDEKYLFYVFKEENVKKIVDFLLSNGDKNKNWWKIQTNVTVLAFWAWYWIEDLLSCSNDDEINSFREFIYRSFQWCAWGIYFFVLLFQVESHDHLTGFFIATVMLGIFLAWEAPNFIPRFKWWFKKLLKKVFRILCTIILITYYVYTLFLSMIIVFSLFNVLKTSTVFELLLNLKWFVTSRVLLSPALQLNYLCWVLHFIPFFWRIFMFLRYQNKKYFFNWVKKHPIIFIYAVCLFFILLAP